MMDFLNSFKSLIKLEQIRTDNNVFRLHYKLTVIVLIVFSILLTSKQYFGDPIQCQVTDKDMKDLIQTYCWIYGTYVVKHTLADEVKGIPGLGTDRRQVAPWIRQLEAGPDDDIIWHKYYQWVCIVFCFQALLFYMPRYLWKTWEGGRLRQLVNDLNTPLVTAAWNQTTKTQLVQYLICGKYQNNLYALRYSVCEFLNLINVVLQIFLMDWFLGGQFSFYGLAMLTSGEINPMTQAFPKLTKCQFWKYGHSGSLENRDALCVLSLNVLNEKLFLVLWFWLFILSVVTLLSLIYRLFVIFVPKLRVYLLMAQARFIGNKHASLIINRMQYGDFFLLYHVGKNINPIIFRELVLGIYETLKTKHPYVYPGVEVNTI
ncbi:Innexin domain containing protein [Asbolus verrucosus]|uniref:Innexin n=1 Tax=Asbolus verrucosus TaxID=1661398 RepID=A0A482VC95_ASBVE|nr:Innexin domain containing protein [Asbolus verrucosus]